MYGTRRSVGSFGTSNYGSPRSGRAQAGRDTFRSTGGMSPKSMQPMHRITPYNTGYVGTGKVCTFAPPSDDFDIHELDFTPPPRVTTIPKRIRVGAKKSRFKVPEQGSTDNRVACRYCGRKFAPDRISTHESICMTSRRKPQFHTRAQQRYGVYDPVYEASISKTGRGNYKSTTELINGKPKYKIVHEELVAALRLARGIEPGAPDPLRKLRKRQEQRMRQGRVKASQRPKLCAMPTDRIECPYCHRKFGEETAKRHIPRCPAQYSVPARGGKRFK